MPLSHEAPPSSYAIIIKNYVYSNFRAFIMPNSDFMVSTVWFS
jgi:hypothetical protein